MENIIVPFEEVQPQLNSLAYSPSGGMDSAGRRIAAGQAPQHYCVFLACLVQWGR